ncbi:hypothetical protein PQR71_41485 [Paraburkholderia fungorum]|uniref:hypothetical protein n=1 Tax=Paraburkholderia fungorum TaxID=134537 RepID=UPI0038BDE1BA
MLDAASRPCMCRSDSSQHSPTQNPRLFTRREHGGKLNMTSDIDAVPVELSGVAETLANGNGFWRSCSGCHETEDGYPIGDYPYSDILKCDLGGGCSECGGIGAVWDDTDYEAMGRDFERAETHATEKFIYDDVCDERIRQDKQWGGDAHDDQHGVLEWLGFVDHQTDKAISETAGLQTDRSIAQHVRARLVKIAALAVAGMASIDRCFPADSIGNRP